MIMQPELVLNAAELDSLNSNLLVSQLSRDASPTLTAHDATLNHINGNMQHESDIGCDSVNRSMEQDSVNNNPDGETSSEHTTLIVSTDDASAIINVPSPQATAATTFPSSSSHDNDDEDVACDLMVKLVEQKNDLNEEGDTKPLSASSSSFSVFLSPKEKQKSPSKSSPLPSSSTPSHLECSAIKLRQHYRQQQQQQKQHFVSMSHGSNVNNMSTAAGNSISFMSRHSIRSIAQSVEQFLNPLGGTRSLDLGLEGSSGNSLAVTKSFRARANSRQSLAQSRTSPVYFSSFHMKWFQGQEELTTTTTTDADIGLDIEMDDWHHGSDDDDEEEEESEEDQNERKRLRLEDFMRQIVSQINENSGKKVKNQRNDNEEIWFDLLLDFTRNFAEYQVPYNRFVNNDNSLIGDILTIALRAIDSHIVQRRVLGCHLLLNIHELLPLDVIESRVVKELERLVQTEQSVPVRFNLSFVLAHFAQRLDFGFFVSTIFPYLKQLVSSFDRHGDDKQNGKTSSNMALSFATLDALIFLLPHLLQLNQKLIKAREQEKSSSAIDQLAQFDSFLQNHYLPLLKHLFELMVDFIGEHKRKTENAKKKLPNEVAPIVEQELIDCFLQWKDANPRQDSITQTLYSHYQNLIFFLLLIRENIKKNSSLEKSTTASTSDPKTIFDQDRWYMEYFDRLCRFLYSSSNDYDESKNSGDENMDTTPSAATSLDEEKENVKDTNIVTFDDMFATSNFSELSTSSHFNSKNANLDHHGSENNRTDVFGFFDYKISMCKSHLISSIPLLFDLYRVTRTTHDWQYDGCPTSKITADSIEEMMSNDSGENNDAQQQQQQQRPEDFIIEKLICSLNSIVIDMDSEIVMKLLYVFEKLITRLDDPLRFYMFMVHVCQSEDNRIVSHLLNSFLDILSHMVKQGCKRKPKRLETGCEELYNSQIEAIVAAFLKVEQLMSSKPNWRIYMQYLHILLKTTRQVPLQTTKQVIVPRLMERLYTLRHITSRQAIVRFLVIVYLENFVHADMLLALRLPGVSAARHARLDVSLFEWAEANLYKANKYQLRQTYIDLVAILVSFLGAPRAKSSSSYYMADLFEQCPALYMLDTAQLASRVIDQRIQLHSPYASLFCLAVTIRHNSLLKRLAELIAEDGVATIRASAAACLWMLMRYYTKFIVECGNYWKTSLDETLNSTSLVTDLVDYFLAFLIGLKDDLNVIMAREKDQLTSSELVRLVSLVTECHREIEGWMYAEMDLKSSTLASSNGQDEDNVIVHTTAHAVMQTLEDEDEMDDVSMLMNDMLTIIETQIQTKTNHGNDDKEGEEEDESYDDEDELFIDQAQEPLIVLDPPPSVVAEFDVEEVSVTDNLQENEDCFVKMETCSLEDQFKSKTSVAATTNDDEEMLDISDKKDAFSLDSPPELPQCDDLNMPSLLGSPPRSLLSSTTTTMTVSGSSSSPTLLSQSCTNRKKKKRTLAPYGVNNPLLGLGPQALLSPKYHHYANGRGYHPPGSASYNPHFSPGLHQQHHQRHHPQQSLPPKQGSANSLLHHPAANPPMAHNNRPYGLVQPPSPMANYQVKKSMGGGSLIDGNKRNVTLLPMAQRFYPPSPVFQHAQSNSLYYPPSVPKKAPLLPTPPVLSSYAQPPHQQHSTHNSKLPVMYKHQQQQHLPHHQQNTRPSMASGYQLCPPAPMRVLQGPNRAKLTLGTNRHGHEPQPTSNDETISPKDSEN